jgi:hypothetical protein
MKGHTILQNAILQNDFNGKGIAERALPVTL